MLGEVQEVACPERVFGSSDCDGKQAIVEHLLQNVMTAAYACYGAPPVQAGSSATTVLPVVVARVAVPKEARTVDPLGWL